MDTFSPEFSEFWLPQTAQSPDREGPDAATKAAEAASQEDALEELAERINAARSVV
jgi:hypothetical protein